MSSTQPGGEVGLTVLLEVQDHDTHLDQLRHRRATLPERGEITRLEQEVARVDRQVAGVEVVLDDLTRQQRRLEDDVAGIEAKAASVHTTLYGGTVTSPRELQDLQSELDALRRRQADLEDQVLELMERLEEPQAECEALGNERARHHETLEAARRSLTAAEAEVDVEIAAVTAERDALAADVPPALLDEYRRLREGLGGIGAARLEAGGRCGGCQLLLSAVERDRIKGLAPDALVHCEECGRLLVRP